MQTICSKSRKKLTSYILCIMLVVSVALLTTGCNSSKGSDASADNGNEAGVQTDDNVLGEGSKEFLFTVVDAEGSETQFEIHTDQETVGAALSELGLIDGEESEYGLYVKTVNGMTADFDKDGAYWAFYVNDEYAQTGVDSTQITQGDSYSFKYQKE